MAETIELTAEDKAVLGRAVEGRNSQQGYILGKRAEFQRLIDNGFVEINEAVKEGKGANLTYAMRASDEGLAAHQTLNGGSGGATSAPAGEVATAKTKLTFTIQKGIEIPKVRRRSGVTGSKYPFDTMEIGDSFHVSPSKELPNPMKSLASSVTAANRRFAKPLEGQHKTRNGKTVDNYELTRKFIIRAVDETDPEGEGVRIWRTDLPENPQITGASNMDDADTGGEDDE